MGVHERYGRGRDGGGEIIGGIAETTGLDAGRSSIWKSSPGGLSHSRRRGIIAYVYRSQSRRSDTDAGKIEF